ncbi:Bgt-150 [Blumeria graminis f. sp. tritici]|uniref:Bgt-150 n=2 Tax=Blumeria graminis f. sp. tritici TaxID=62690 RepID=A0A061HPM8_BLUGR|nr:hypothetical protein BGT96224_150 [Blumeria graminis f. sp. tritici 96224]VDB93882.1 Bgt-150 [Blumeria graminis f. sp. tritici]
MDSSKSLDCNLSQVDNLEETKIQCHITPSCLPKRDSPSEDCTKKRKFEIRDNSECPSQEQGVKEKKQCVDSKPAIYKYEALHNDKSLIPAEIWHYIFTQCTIKDLGALLKVNQLFNSYLDANSVFKRTVYRQSQSFLKILEPDIIWKASRKVTNSPCLPTPPEDKTELDMYRLAYGSLCQECGKQGKIQVVDANDPWHPGPGENGVVPIWSFGVRLCGKCLETSTSKVNVESEMLLYSELRSTLLTALPSIFLSNELHIVPSVTLKNKLQCNKIHISKRFSRAQIQEIKKEYEEVSAMGGATVEEWLKGLDSRGKRRRNDALRWERWQQSGGLDRLKPHCTAGKANSSNIFSHSKTQEKTKGDLLDKCISGPLGLSSDNRDFKLVEEIKSTDSNSPTILEPIQNGYSHFTWPQPQPKHDRTKIEIAEMKAARKAEIERRCLTLNPPLPAEELFSMASFQAAIQIIQPFTDNAWELLKPRLVSQREETKHRERETFLVEQKTMTQPSKKEGKNPTGRVKEDSPTPLLTKIGGFADDFIRDEWNGGERVWFENSPLFAARVLIHVRKRFYTGKTEKDVHPHTTRQISAGLPPNKKLSLENMKWVFDTKVKPITDKFRKTLFLCNACDLATRYYGFEAVIQHYAAKHTTQLSLGKLVVCWKSEWPEESPFKPNPSSTPLHPIYNFGPSASTDPILTRGHSSVPDFSLLGSSIKNCAKETHGASNSILQHRDSEKKCRSSRTGITEQTQYGTQGVTSSIRSDHCSESSTHQSSIPPTICKRQENVEDTPFSTNQHVITLQEDNEYNKQLQNFAGHIRDIWASIGSLKKIPGTFKAYTLVFHIIKRFKDCFKQNPPLILLKDVLHQKDMHPVRNIHGLLCEACSSAAMRKTETSNPEKNMFSFFQLVKHFHLVHEQNDSFNQANLTIDWTHEMVKLSELGKICSIIESPGIDKNRLSLFVEAIPQLTAKMKSITENEKRTNTDSVNIVTKNNTQSISIQDTSHESSVTSVKKNLTGTNSAANNNGETNLSNPIEANRRPGKSDIKSQHPPQQIEEYHKALYSKSCNFPMDKKTAISHKPSKRDLNHRDEIATLNIQKNMLNYTREGGKYFNQQEPKANQTGSRSLDPSREIKEPNPPIFMTAKDGRNKMKNVITITDTADRRNDRTLNVVVQVSQQQQPSQGRRLDARGELSYPEFSTQNRTQNIRGDRLQKYESRTSDLDDNSLYYSRIDHDVGYSTSLPGPLHKRFDYYSRSRHNEEITRSRNNYSLPEPSCRDTGDIDDDCIYLGSKRIVDTLPNNITAVGLGPLDRDLTQGRRPYELKNIPIPHDHSINLQNSRYSLENKNFREGTHDTRDKNTHSSNPSTNNRRIEKIRRSRSPPYIRTDQPPGYQQDASAMYREISRPSIGRVVYERSPSEQYYNRLYSDEPSYMREPWLSEEYELVRISDPYRDYSIRRPSRHRMHAVSESEPLLQPPFYETCISGPEVERRFKQENELQDSEPPHVYSHRRARNGI